MSNAVFSSFAKFNFLCYYMEERKSGKGGRGLIVLLMRQSRSVRGESSDRFNRFMGIMLKIRKDSSQVTDFSS